MELLAPAGNLEKLYYAYTYGADAAYIGIDGFSLRARADNVSADQWKNMEQIKGDKKLYGALNIFFHQEDLKRLEDALPAIARYPFDALIVSDLGVVDLLKKHFPTTALHLSTQANCINAPAARMYRDMGFSRVVLGRETPLSDIAEIKEAVPELEIEAFAHGAMCIAYSGRCFLSRYLSDRSANQGDCSHSCRWHYRLHNLEMALEEEKRPGEYFPVYEGDGFTSILSSKDMCMIDYLQELQQAGVDSVKIEGRMKSIYYTAVTVRAYRKALDALDSGGGPESWNGYRNELFKVSRREYSTGFYFGTEEIEASTEKSYSREYLFLGSVGRKVGDNTFELIVKNQIRSGEEIEYIGPEVLYLPDSSFQLFDESGQKVEKVDHGKPCTIHSKQPLKPGYILRKKHSEVHTEGLSPR
ncbi:MAG: peptidase U32 family protein [Spirochaetota bacterium]